MAAQVPPPINIAPQPSDHAEWTVVGDEQLYLELLRLLFTPDEADQDVTP